EPPAVLLAQEQPQFGPLPAQATDYGFFDCVVVSREGLVAIETNRYSVPAHLMGRALTARIHRSRIELFADNERVATSGSPRMCACPHSTRGSLTRRILRRRLPANRADG